MAGAKECSTGVLDGIFDYICGASTVNNVRIHITTSSSPTALTANTSGELLAASTFGGVPGTSYYTIGSSGNNRYMTISACSCDTVWKTGIATCVVLFAVGCSEAMYVTTCTTQTITLGNKVNIGSWTITVNQPT